MSAKLKTASVIVGGALSAMGIPTAYAATTATHPGLAAPRAGVGTPLRGTTGHPKSAAPNVDCGNTVTWQDGYDNRYLEIYHSGTAAGNWADAYPGNGTCTQQWFAVISGSSNFFCDGGECFQALYGMVNANSDLCLAGPVTNIGNSHVVQEPCGYSFYDYKWAEVSRPGGWELVETQLDGNFISPTGNFVAACEDTVNHWIYTSHWYNGYSASNCIWH